MSEPIEPSARIPLISGDEYDGLSRRCRKYYRFGPKARRYVKMAYRRRYRQLERLALRFMVQP